MKNIRSWLAFPILRFVAPTAAPPASHHAVRPAGPAVLLAEVKMLQIVTNSTAAATQMIGQKKALDSPAQGRVRAWSPRGPCRCCAGKRWSRSPIPRHMCFCALSTAVSVGRRRLVRAGDCAGRAGLHPDRVRLCADLCRDGAPARVRQCQSSPPALVGWGERYGDGGFGWLAGTGKTAGLIHPSWQSVGSATRRSRRTTQHSHQRSVANLLSVRKQQCLRCRNRRLPLKEVNHD